MAWAATTSFETTDGSTAPTDGNDIAGTGDGSGWTGNWTEAEAATGYHNYDSGVAGIPDGSWTCECNTGSSNLEPAIYRDISSAVTSGRLSFYVRFNKENRDNPMIQFNNTTTRRAYVYFVCATDGTGRTLADSTGNIATGVFFKNTWYRVDIDFDCSTDTYDVYVDGTKKNGTARGFESAATNIDRIYWRNNAASVSGSSAGNIHWIDKIADGAAAAPSGPAKLKTRDTIQKSAIKSIDGVLIAAVKSVDTIT